MKTSNYLWAALATATLSLSACSSDENENGMQPKEKTAKLELTLVGAPADSRASDVGNSKQTESHGGRRSHGYRGANPSCCEGIHKQHQDRFRQSGAI